MKKNLLIVEDHELTRFGLKTTFEDVDYIENIYAKHLQLKMPLREFSKNNSIDLVIMV